MLISPISSNFADTSFDKTMKRLFTFIAVAVFTVSVVSCNKTVINDTVHGGGNSGSNPEGNEPTEEYGEFELAEGAIFLTEDQTELFSSVEDGKIIISTSVPEGSVPEAGDVIVSPITEKTPAGLLVKVVSVRQDASGYIIATEPATLEEAFEELHVNTAMDLSAYLENAVDEDGNVIVPEDVSSKASGTFAQQLKIENNIFEGVLLSELTLNAAIDISGHTLERFDVSITKQTAIEGKVIILAKEKRSEWIIAKLELKFRPFLIPGTPIVLTPVLYAEEKFESEGKLELKSAFRYQFEHQKYTFSYNHGDPTYGTEDLRKNDENYIRFISLSSEASMGLRAALGGRFDFYNSKVLSFGIELASRQEYKIETEISMEDEGLLKTNLEIEVSPSLETSIYCQSKLFSFIPGIEESKLSYTQSFGIQPSVTPLLPEFSEIKKNNSGKELTVSANIDKNCLLVCTEMGFALFEEGSDEPLEHIAFNSENDAEGMITDEVTFILPDPEKDYLARSYVVADEKYYYGGEVKKRLKRMIMDNNSEEYSYDEEGRLSTITQKWENQIIRALRLTYNDSTKNILISNEDNNILAIISDNVITTYPDDIDSDITYLYYNDNMQLDSFKSNSTYCSYIWDNGNITGIHTSITDGINDTESQETISYGEIENKCNIDWITRDSILLPAYEFYIYAVGNSITRYLPTTASPWSYSYSFDEDNYIVSYKKHSPLDGGVTYTRSFEWEEY